MSHTNASAQQVRPWLIALQKTIVDALQHIEDQAGSGVQFVREPWQKSADEPLQGDGITCIIEGGQVFERAGCGFSHVRGAALPPSATQKRPELAGAPFEALGVSLVFHPG